VVTNEWNTGFTAAVRIKNTGTSTISGWTVSWNYTATADRATSFWNGTVTGSNPYTATNLSWNGTLTPGQTAEVGVQGTKADGTSANVPAVTGALCK